MDRVRGGFRGGRGGGHQNGGYGYQTGNQNGGYQNGGRQNGGYQNGGYQNGGSGGRGGYGNGNDRNGGGRGGGYQNGGTRGRGGFQGGDRGANRGNGLMETAKPQQRHENTGPKKEFIDMTVAKETIRTKPTAMTSKMGSSGTVVELTTNFFPITTEKNWDIFQYRIDFSEDIPDTRHRKSLVASQKNIIGGHCFDGTMMFTVRPLTVSEITTRLPHTDEIVQIKIKEVGIMSRTDQRFLQIYSIILNRAMGRLNLTQVGRDFFDSKAAINIPEHGVQLWPGYQTSIHQHEDSILMNVDIRSKFIRLDTVRHLFDNCQHSRNLMTANTVGQIVMTMYNNTTYRVDRIDFEKSPNSTFKKGDTEMSYFEYYKQRYNVTIKDRGQPLLVSNATARQKRGGSPEEFFLVPELCQLTGLTDAMRSDMRMMRDLAQHTRVNPLSRQQKLMAFSQRMKGATESQAQFKEFGLKLHEDLLKVKGRVLPPVKISFNNSVKSDDRPDWTNHMKSSAMSQTVTLDNWYVVVRNTEVQGAEKFVRDMKEVAVGLGMRIEQPKFVQIQSDRPADYVRELEMVCGRDPKFVMAIVSNDQGDRYSMIKKTLSVNRSVLSQVVQRRNLDKGKTIATKVVVQINTKLGGAPWKIPMHIKRPMFIGFDVCHDTRDRSKSFAAFVASMDQSKSNAFFSAAAAHRNGEELSNSFGQMTKQAIQRYFDIHNELPQYIIVYRDGVGDGQIPFVMDHELAQLKAVVRDIYQGREVGPPKMAFIIVSKRINAKFFVRGSDNNVKAGTVVDSGVTLAERYDFFLVSQQVNQGTATPTSYNVIYDTTGLSPDHMQRLTHILCHGYYNWSGTVRVPHVCQYAHKLSLLVGQYLHEEPNPNLSNTLYFL